MKKIYSILIGLLAIVSVLAEVKSGDTGPLSWSYDTDTKVLTISGTGWMPSYDISGSPWVSFRSDIEEVVIESEGITIGSYAFYGCSSLTSITLPESVTDIGNGAFSGCSVLQSISIPESVRSIGSYAFSGCTALKSLVYNATYCAITNPGWTSIVSLTIGDKVNSIPSDIFFGCSVLTTVTILESVTRIGSYAFYGCSSLTSITLPESLTTIEYNAFQGCSSLATITFPESITTIESGAFSGTAWYNNQPDGIVYIGKILYKYKGYMPTNTTINVKEGIIKISGSAFSGCNSLVAVTFPESVTEIGGAAFSNCSSLASVTFPESITQIRGGAFSGCSSLTSLVIPESVTGIDGGTFSNCIALKNLTYNAKRCSYIYYSNPVGWTSITTLTIGDKVEDNGNIGSSYIFSGCTELTEITVNAVTPPKFNPDTFKETDHTIPVYIPYGTLEAYQSAKCWNEFNLIEQPSNGVKENTLPNVAIYVQGRDIVISGMEAPEVSVYDVNGKIVASGNTNRITVSQAGVYVVRVGGIARKVVL